MKTYTITISDAQDKALSVAVASQQEWIENAVNVRCNAVIDEIVASEVQRKLAAGETISGTKDEIVLAANIRTAAQRNEDAAAQFAAQQAAQE